MSAQEFANGQCTTVFHGLPGTGFTGIKDLVKYEVYCSNPACTYKAPPTEDFKTARFRAQSHEWKEKAHPTLIKTTETYRDGHTHELIASPDMAMESKGATGYKSTKAEQRAVRKNMFLGWTDNVSQ